MTRFKGHVIYRVACRTSSVLYEALLRPRFGNVKCQNGGVLTCFPNISQSAVKEAQCAHIELPEDHKEGTKKK